MLHRIIPQFLNVHRAEVEWMRNKYEDQAAEMRRFARSFIGQPNFTFVVHLAYLPILTDNWEEYLPSTKQEWIDAWERYLEPAGSSEEELTERFATFFRERGANHGVKIIAKAMSKYLTLPITERASRLELVARETMFYKPKDAEEVISYYANFSEVRQPYLKRIPQLLRDPRFDNRIIMEQRIRDIALAAGWTLTDDEVERQLLEIAKDNNLEPWFLDRLLVDFSKRFMDMIKEN